MAKFNAPIYPICNFIERKWDFKSYDTWCSFVVGKLLLEILIGELNVWFSYVGSWYDMLKVLSLNTFYYGILIP
jgi:hypothetical protein